MNRPLKRPPHPSSGEAAIGPQTMDEIIRRLNQSQGVQLPKQGLQLRWFRPLSDDEFGDKQAAVNQPATDDKPILFDDENLLHFRDLNRYSGEDVPAYCPSMWCMWVESDVEASDQAPLDMDPMERCIEVYFPMYAWARNNANAEASQKNVEILKRILMSKRDKGRFPAAFNTRTGRWECVSLTEALPAQIWAIPSTTIPPADKIGGTARELKSGLAKFWVNDALGTPIVHDVLQDPDNTTTVYNWLTETSLESGEVYLFWLDVTTGYYMVDQMAEAQSDMIVAEVTESPGVSECSPVGRNLQCLYPAKKVLNNPAASQCGDTPWTDAEEILLMDITGCEPSTTLKKGDRYLAKRLGVTSFNGQDRELYAIRGDKSSTSVKVIEIDYDEQGAENCTAVQTNEGCVYRAIISNNSLGDQCSGQWSAGELVWAINVASCSQPASVKKGDRFVGLGLGSLAVAGETRPLYAFRHVDGADQTRIVTVLPYTSQPLPCQTIDPQAPECILRGSISTAFALDNADAMESGCSMQNWTNQDDIWIVNLAACGGKARVPFGERFIGQYVSDFLHDGETKPLYAIYYREAQQSSAIVQVQLDVVGPCESVSPNSSCVYPGVLLSNAAEDQDQCQRESFTDEAPIWIVDVANCPYAGEIPNNERFVGHRLGYHTHAGETLPLYGIKYVPANVGVAGAYFESETMISSTIDTQDFFFSGSGTGVSPRSGLSIVGGALFNSSGVQLRYQVHAQFVIYPLGECETAGGAIGLGGLPGGGAYISTTYQHAGWPLNPDQYCADSEWPITAPNFVGCISGVITVPANAIVSGWHFRANGDAIMTYYMRGTLTRLE